MKTREEIEREYAAQREAIGALAKAKHQNNEVQYRANAEAITDAELADLDALAAARDAALAELDDPMARLIAAGRRAMKSHNGARECRCGQCIEILNAIDYAEQRRAQG